MLLQLQVRLHSYALTADAAVVAAAADASEYARSQHSCRCKAESVISIWVQWYLSFFDSCLPLFSLIS